MLTYWVHGLRITSEVPLPDLPEVSGQPDVAFAIVPATSPPVEPVLELYVTPGATSSDDTTRIVVDATGVTVFQYGDGTVFQVDLRTTPIAIAARIADGQVIDDLAAYLYGPVLGYVLRSRGTLAMHASAVILRGAVSLFAGASGAGKSTAAAALSLAGYSVISDDLTALSFEGRNVRAHPGFTHLRLWPSSEQVLYGRSDVLPRISPGWDKRRLSMNHDRFPTRSLPLRTIYILGDRAPRAEIGPLHARDALLSLATLTYANYLLDAPLRARELVQLGSLVSNVRVRTLRVSNAADWRDDLVATLAADQPFRAQ